MIELKFCPELNMWNVRIGEGDDRDGRLLTPEQMSAFVERTNSEAMRQFVVYARDNPNVWCTTAAR